MPQDRLHLCFVPDIPVSQCLIDLLDVCQRQNKSSARTYSSCILFYYACDGRIHFTIMKPPAFDHYFFESPRQLYLWNNMKGDKPAIQQIQGHIESYESGHNKKWGYLIQACFNIRDHSRGCLILLIH